MCPGDVACNLFFHYLYADQVSSRECLVRPAPAIPDLKYEKIQLRQRDIYAATVPTPEAAPRADAGVPGYIPYIGKKTDLPLPDHRFIAVGFSGQMRENTFHAPDSGE